MKRILIVVGLVTLLAGAGWIYQAANTYVANAKTRQFNENVDKFNQDVDNLFRSLQKYKERVGSYPIGSNAEISKALKGNNSKNVIILSGTKENLNDKGEYLDPWGTPLRFYFSGDSVLIRSAGPNRRFDDSTVLNSDDYYRSN
jgi:hypothetical protein